MGNKEIQHFKVLNDINVSGKTEKKGGLSYLSWTWAWAETKKRFPQAKYDIIRNEKGLPYFFDENTGYMVFTFVEIEGIRHDMWLPVMDAHNRAMKAKSYKYTTKKGYEINIEAATMFDINKALMRCLTKNLAMFGVGLYIYSGEDLPEIEGEKISNINDEVLKKVKKILFIAANRDKDKAVCLLKKYTEFKGKDGKTVEGLKEFEKLKDKRLMVTYGKIKEIYPEIHKAIEEVNKETA